MWTYAQEDGSASNSNTTVNISTHIMIQESNAKHFTEITRQLIDHERITLGIPQQHNITPSLRTKKNDNSLYAQ